MKYHIIMTFFYDIRERNKKKLLTITTAFYADTTAFAI